MICIENNFFLIFYIKHSCLAETRNAIPNIWPNRREARIHNILLKTYKAPFEHGR